MRRSSAPSRAGAAAAQQIASDAELASSMWRQELEEREAHWLGLGPQPGGGHGGGNEGRGAAQQAALAHIMRGTLPSSSGADSTVAGGLDLALQLAMAPDLSRHYDLLSSLPVVARPANRAALSRATVVAQVIDGSGETCSVCLDDMGEGDEVRPRSMAPLLRCPTLSCVGA